MPPKIDLIGQRFIKQKKQQKGGMTMEELLKALEKPIMIYLSDDGTATIDWPSGRPLDHATIQRIAEQIEKEVANVWQK